MLVLSAIALITAWIAVRLGREEAAASPHTASPLKVLTVAAAPPHTSTVVTPPPTSLWLRVRVVLTKFHDASRDPTLWYIRAVVIEDLAVADIPPGLSSVAASHALVHIDPSVPFAPPAPMTVDVKPNPLRAQSNPKFYLDPDL